MESNVTYRQGVKFFESKCQVIAVICNCTSDRSIGFIRQVSERFPYVDINKNRVQKPGTLELWGKKKHGQRYVLGLFAQHSRDDQGDQRLEWFKTCLKKITKQIPSLKSIAFPRKNKSLGCKCSYIRAIEDWAKSMSHISVEIVEIETPQERYLDPPSSPPSPFALSAPSEREGVNTQEKEEEPYFEKIEYKKIENEVYGWISRHTNMDAVPNNQEKCSELVTSLSALLLKDNPDLYHQIESIVPVEDDLFSILEQEASNTDLN